MLGAATVGCAAIVAMTVAPGAGAATSHRVGRAHQTSAQCPWVGSSQPIAQRVAELMGQMSVSDEDFLVEGHGTTNEGPNPSPNPYVFWMPGISSLCIPDLGEEDGPAGVADQLTGVTQLPAGVDLAATFDPSLAHQYGQVIGQEELGKGAAVNLGPTVNIDRDPRWGRSFEAFTEDPYLNSSLATGEIDGVQSTGEMSQVKHFDAYNNETNRNTPQDDVIVSQRTLHEIYMPAFEAAVKQAKVASAMCAYSVVNGSFSCQNRYLLTSVLKEEWDFPGFVTSDYGALHDTLGGALAGLDQEQPFNTFFGAPLENDVNNGTISRSILNTMVQRILTEMFRFGLFDHPLAPTTGATVTTPAHQALGTQVADTGTTLLKNDNGTLPLPRDHAGTVAVIGPSASASPTYGGGGSAYVVPSQTVTPLQGIQAAAGSGTSVVYQQGLPTDASLPPIPASALSPAYPAGGTPYGGSYTGTLTAPETGTYVLAVTNPCGCYTPTYLSLNGQQILDNPSTPPVNVYSVAVNLVGGQKYTLQISGASSVLAWGTPSALKPGIDQAVAAAKSASNAVVVVSDDTESEATDRLSLNLPSAQDELISKVAAANPHTTVVIDAGAPVAMPWVGQVGAVLDAWYPGQSSGTSLARVLFGQVNPSGHLPVTFPTSLSQVPASSPSQFPGVNGQLQYSEGLQVGYRWYDANNVTPLFPFGFGLSYTRFRFSDLRVGPIASDGVSDVQVSARITNVGDRSGADVAQLYLGDPSATGEPPRQLVDFQRVSLGPGESTRVRFTITPRDTWWWDENANGWSQSAGAYRVYVGDSSAPRDLPLRAGFFMFRTPGARQVVVSAPGAMKPGTTYTVRVTLTAAGNETLRDVRIALQLPEGWSAQPVGRTSFRRVRPRKAPVATFRVTPPSWEPATNQVVHATADLGPDAQREAGVTVAVG
ncbi:MAG: glycoside hydrolase family 3 C-terminal domain-containing protein [Solirubrobacterales bacterium]|nr:glycoside hydrolase family 3 C-terminal domain-containing protein [Solirubrobacterales bacterium]